MVFRRLVIIILFIAAFQYCDRTSIIEEISDRANARAGIVETGLVGWYRFNGNANDQLGSNNGTASASVTFVADRFGNPGYAVSAINPHSVNLGANTVLSPNPFTVGTWFKVTNLNAGAVEDFIGNYVGGGFIQGYRLRIDENNGQVTAETGDGGAATLITSNINLSAGKWYYIAISATSAGTLKLYIGEHQGSIALNAESAPGVAYSAGAASPMLIETPANAPGNIDELVIYNRELSINEITTNFNATNID